MPDNPIQIPQPHTEGTPPRRRRKQKRKLSPPMLIAAVILLCVLAAGGYYAWNKYRPNNQRMEFFAWHTGYTGMAVVRNEILCPPSVMTVVQNGVPYLPVQYVKETIDPHLFWDAEANRIAVTTPTRLIRLRTEELSYFVNNDEFVLNLSPLRIHDEAYLPIDLLMELYHIDIVWHEETGLVVIDDKAEARMYFETQAKTTALRFEPNHKSPVLDKLPAGTVLTMFSNEGGWVYARTADGRLGYAQVKEPVLLPMVAGIPTPVEAVPSPAISGKINLVWDQISTAEASANAERRQTYDGLDVISPTWFSFDLDSLNGDIVSIADLGYVDWAHTNGLQVWGLITDNFNEVVTRDILSDTDKREHVIRQLLALAATYRLDGINIDFEMVRLADVAHYHQFLRELAPMLREQGVILSVDTYVPMPYSMYYNRGEIARVADYLIIFGYDEYNGSSTEAGPVASLGFVRNGVMQTLQEAPPEKVILGVPFYVRVWKETPTADGTVVTSRAVGMNYARQILEDGGASIIWDAAAGCFYGEFIAEEDGVDVRTRVWLEDEYSMAKKLALVTENDLAGVAGWRLGLEKEEIWPLLDETLR